MFGIPQGFYRISFVVLNDSFDNLIGLSRSAELTLKQLINISSCIPEKYVLTLRDHVGQC